MTPKSSVPKKPSGLMVWAALWTVYIVWGSTYLAIRVTVETLPALLAGGVRFLAAGGIMYGFLWVRKGRAALKVTRRELVSSALVGGALLLGGNGMVSLAEKSVPSGLAALIIASVPLWVVLFRTVSGDRISKGALLGVVVGFFGVGLLVLPGGRPTGATIAGILLVVLAAAFWATGSFASTKLRLPADPFVSTAIQMLFGGAWMMLAGLLSGEGSGIAADRFSVASMLALAYLIVFGSLFAFTAYVWLLQNAPISRVATYAYVNPVIAIFLGAVILDEEITAAIVVGAAIIVAAVAFIVRKEAPAPEDSESGPEASLVAAVADP